jgi:hypothetical protein
MMRAKVYGDDSWLDLADEVTDDTIPIVKRAANAASDVYLNDLRSRLRSRKGPGAAPEGQSPAEQTGELVNGLRRIAANVKGRIVKGGVRHTSMDYEEINSIEYGAVGPSGRVSKARPFIRPAEAALEKNIGAEFERAL